MEIIYDASQEPNQTINVATLNDRVHGRGNLLFVIKIQTGSAVRAEGVHG